MAEKRLVYQWRISRRVIRGSWGKCLEVLLESSGRLWWAVGFAPSHSSWNRSRETSHVVTWNKYRPTQAAEVMEHANKDELMRNLSGTRRPQAGLKQLDSPPPPIFRVEVLGHSVAGAFVLLWGVSAGLPWMLYGVRRDSETWFQQSQRGHSGFREHVIPLSPK